MKREILDETPMSAFEVKEDLKKIKKQEKELNFRAGKTEDYLNQIVTLDTKTLAEIKDKLEKLKIPRLKAQHIAKLLDVLPKTEKDVKVLLQGYAITVTKENMVKIAKVVDSLVPD